MQKSESYWKEGTVSQKKNRGATGEDHGTTAIQKKDNIRRRKRTRNIRIKVEEQAKNRIQMDTNTRRRTRIEKKMEETEKYLNTQRLITTCQEYSMMDIYMNMLNIMMT